jgi:hypothetical protein
MPAVGKSGPQPTLKASDSGKAPARGRSPLRALAALPRATLITGAVATAVLFLVIVGTIIGLSVGNVEPSKGSPTSPPKAVPAVRDTSGSQHVAGVRLC